LRLKNLQQSPEVHPLGPSVTGNNYGLVLVKQKSKVE